jgi:hypothetical protein
MAPDLPEGAWQTMAANGRRNADARLVVELATGKTVSEAAAAVGVGERTVFRRLADTAFKLKVTEARNAFSERALAKLAAASTRAVDTLVSLLDAEADSVRLGAARSILDAGVKLRMVDFEERLTRLEAQRAEGSENAAGAA